MVFLKTPMTNPTQAFDTKSLPKHTPKNRRLLSGNKSIKRRKYRHAMKQNLLVNDNNVINLSNKNKHLITYQFYQKD